MVDLTVVHLGNLIADGSTVGVQITGSMRNDTGSVNARSGGQFGGGVLTYEGSIDNVVWYGLGPDSILSVPGGVELALVEGEYMRTTLTGSTTPNVDTDILISGSVRIS